MMKKNQRKNFSQKGGEAKGVTLQITKLDPAIYEQLLIYEASHQRMEHHEVFERAFVKLLESEQPK